MAEAGMYLLRHGDPGAERPGVLAPDGTVRDLSAELDDVAGAALDPTALAELAGRLNPHNLPEVPPARRLGPCLGRVPNFLCIGLNYADHAAETGMAIPAEPVVFSKAAGALSGPYDPIEIPRGAEKVDWEVELGVAIGRRGRYLTPEDAPAHIAGFCSVCDVSERSFQAERGGQWIKGKSHDGFGPIGPYLVTPEALGDPQRLQLWLAVDGQRRQDGTTARMIWSPAELVAYLTQFFTLLPGDIIATGTPPGVAKGMAEPAYLRPGQYVELAVEPLGRQQHSVVAAP